MKYYLLFEKRKGSPTMCDNMDERGELYLK